MISGSVNANLEPKVSLSIQGPSQLFDIDALLDTGYTGFLTLPRGLIHALGWRWLSRQDGMLADGSTQILDVFEATIIWDGQPRIVEAIAIDAHPLAGMGLVAGYELRVEVKNGGAITISRLP